MTALRILPLALFIGACTNDTPDHRRGDYDYRPGDSSAGDSAGDDGLSGACQPGSVEPICSTNLAGVGIVWSDTLELCNYWQDQPDLDVELARKVHLTLPPQSRAGLAKSALSSATLDDVRVRRSPFAADQQHVVAADVISTIDTYDLTGPLSEAMLNVLITHELGTAGTLAESFTVFRQPGNNDPVVYDGVATTFTFFSLGQTAPEDAIPLQPCDGHAGLASAAQVLVGEATGGEQVTVLRLFNSRLGIGSYPVYFTGARVTLSEQPWSPFDASSRWAFTYAAQHHNWEEHSLLDFSRNLTDYHTYLSSGTSYTHEVIRDIEFFNIAGSSGDQTIDVTFVDLATDGTRSTTYTVQVPWAWVDDESLRLSYLGNCANGDVFTLGGSEYQFQLVTCPRTAPPGFDLLALAPVAFAHDMLQAGKHFIGSNIVETTVDSKPAFGVTVGASEVDIIDFSETYFRLTVRDSGGQTVQDRLASPTDLRIFWSDEILRAESTAAGIYTEVKRRWAAQGVGESAIYAPVHFVLSFNGETHFVEAWDRIDYTNTHHNWGDSLVAEDDTLRMFWRVQYANGPLVHWVRAETLDGVEVLVETEVTLLP